VLADDPRLDVRLVPTTLQPLRVVLDSTGRMPASSAILRPPGSVLWIQARGTGPAAKPLSTTAAERLLVAGDARGLDLQAVVDALGQRQINEVHVEAGPTLNAALLQAGLIDEILLYQAPMLIGPGRPLADLDPLPALDQAQRFERRACDTIGADLRLLLRARQT